MNGKMRKVLTTRSIWYKNSNGKVRTNNRISDELDLEAGVQHGCIIFPLHFNKYSEHIMREALECWTL